MNKQENFSKTEKFIANKILENKVNWKTTSARTIASQLFIAPSTLSRFCQKAGYKGFIDFRVSLLKELDYIENQEKDINPNLPFEYVDNAFEISKKIEQLYTNTVRNTYSLLKTIDLEKVSSYINKYNTICLFSLGNTGPLYNFEKKMIRIGKQVLVTQAADDVFYYGNYHSEDWLFILVSYSGETPSMLRVASFLKQRGASTLGISSFGDNSLESIVSYSLRLATGENLRDNFGDFSVNISENYIFDVLYSLCFSKNFVKNYHNKVDIAREYEKKRISNNKLLKD
ncbi:DNA-binding MurR/RpiR family transcriptional regulator [Lactobacillus colini]|uniref:DNA-binding MurR/RpiR family transcriptional regulator n=1 Tax=Lactobacillus colini TaxID=1819254 RepID=A0ABS4MFT2_9LACO|nr:MurR/RpiR family transcriptional regulator [Lactobacillus colini]MBP2058539.1 DNA-binding MurR/RpiR family transcriptional regulator [Lactobacillus colini]